MVFSDIVSSIHQVVSHDIEKIQRAADVWESLLGEGYHVPPETWYCSRKDGVSAECVTDVGEEFGVVLVLFAFAVVIRVALVVFAVSTIYLLEVALFEELINIPRVFPINIDAWLILVVCIDEH
jgi:hypothetical protein